MKVAVLMSTYNGEKYIREQIASILEQQGDFSLDIWVRDDGSADATRQILEEYAADGKLQWYTGENLKPARSFWDLLLHCRGYDYYAFADQDDVWLPGKLQSAVASLAAESGPAAACANACLVGSDLESLGRNVYLMPPPTDLETMSIAGGILGCTMVINKALAELLQSRPMPRVMVMHDFYIALVCKLAGGKLCFDMTPQILYRQHGNNVVGASKNKIAALKDRVRTVTRRARVSVCDQAKILLEQYPYLGTNEQRRWVRKLANPTLGNRLFIACSRKTHYPNKNKAITLRLAVFLGNR